MQSAREIYQRMVAVAYAETADFHQLVQVAGVDPSHDFERILITGDFCGIDFKGYNFTGARFRGDVSGSDFSQTVVAGAKFSRATARDTKWPGEIQQVVDLFLRGEKINVKNLNKTVQGILIATRNAMDVSADDTNVTKAGRRIRINREYGNPKL